MTESDVMDYRAYLFKMTDEELDKETSECVRQAQSVHDDMRNRTCMMIQLCYNDWRRRDQGARFLKAYNQSLQPATAIEHEFR